MLLQGQNIRFDYITTDHGLSQSVVECIYKDSRGLMWFGTRDGLNKYDGYNFVVYKFDREDSLSLDNSAVTAIEEDLTEIY
ncbi:MAG: hypothetical protein HC905_20410 [Bacteroidales bacterium]|nr:hypothetical protein [Bacteroidales bacterium]